jgi:hypothetical protein
MIWGRSLIRMVSICVIFMIRFFFLFNCCADVELARGAVYGAGTKMTRYEI